MMTLMGATYGRVFRALEEPRQGWLSGTVVLGLLGTVGVWFAAQATAELPDPGSNDVSAATKDSRSSRSDAAVDQESAAQVQADSKPPARFDPTANAMQHIAKQGVGPKDWPQWCGSPHRNNTPAGDNIPTRWDLKTGENVLWTRDHAKGNVTTPVVANDKLFVGGNNLPSLVSRYSNKIDLGCLRAYDAATGQFLWQSNHHKLQRSQDWPSIGVCSPPTVEGDRLWYVSNRSEVVCLDTEGFRDDENDGPFVDEKDHDKTDADIIWQVDLVKEFQIEPHLVSASTVLCVGELCFVITSNGVGENLESVVNPQAPSFVCLNKQTGKIVWTDNSPGSNILAGSWSSPCAFEIGGEMQVVMAGGDGWLYSFTAEGDGQGRAELLWKFDANPKESRFIIGNPKSPRSSILATPVFYGGHVYFGVGESPEHGEGPGRLWCLDPTRRGDVSSELAVDSNGQPLPQRRMQAIDTTKGEKAIPNPNSAAIWCYTGRQPGKKNDVEQSMHRTLGNVAIKNDLVFVADIAGVLHCLDARETIDGKPVVYWTHDLLATTWGTPLIVEDKVYVGDEEGNVLIFTLSREKQLIAEQNFNNSIETTPIVANDTLFINTTHQLVAIRQTAKKPSQAVAP